MANGFRAPSKSRADMELSKGQEDRMTPNSYKRRWRYRIKAILTGRTEEEILSRSSASRINISQSTIHHTDSFQNMGLLARLPPEVRLRIYEYVFAHQPVLHLKRDAHQVRHFRCFRPITAPDLGLCSCFERKAVGDIYPPLETAEASPVIPFANGNLALLRTCRQIYREGIDLVYTHNVFSVNNLLVLLELANYQFPQHRLATIRHLRVEWKHYNFDNWASVPYRSKAWVLFWNVVATRMRLRSLYVFLVYNLEFSVELDHVIDLDAAWARAMLAVKGIEDVKVRIVPEKLLIADWNLPLQEFGEKMAERMSTRTEA